MAVATLDRERSPESNHATLLLTPGRPEEIRGEITPEDLLRLPDCERAELINGRLVEKKAMGLYTSVVLGALTGELSIYVRSSGLGWVPAGDCGYQCFSVDRNRIRKPDASFISRERLPATGLQEGFVRIPPDLAVEVVSPNDLALSVREKIEEYLAAGVRLIWVVYPETGVAEVLRANGTVLRLTREDSLDGEDVIPGFRCRLGDLFPPLIEGGGTETTAGSAPIPAAD